MIIKITSIILLLFLSACGDMGAISDAKKKISSQMRDPDSVQFRDVKSAAEDFVCGEVNAKNGFGAYSGFTSFSYDAFNDKICIVGVSDDCGSIFDESVCTNTPGGREAALHKSFLEYSEGCKTGKYLFGFTFPKDFLCNKANQLNKELDAVRARYGQKILDNSSTTKTETPKTFSGAKPGTPYAEVRANLISQGWTPIKQDLDESAFAETKIRNENGWFEVISCAGTGQAPCVFSWKNNKSELVEILTLGEEPVFNSFR